MQSLWTTDVIFCDIFHLKRVDKDGYSRVYHILSRCILIRYLFTIQEVGNIIYYVNAVQARDQRGRFLLLRFRFRRRDRRVLPAGVAVRVLILYTDVRRLRWWYCFWLWESRRVTRFVCQYQPSVYLTWRNFDDRAYIFY